MGGSDDVEREIDDLYVRRPEGFTSTRDALATRLKAQDAAGARRVSALRRPVRSAWALNRLVREDRHGVEALIASGERLRAAQRRALSVRGAEALREASEERRALVASLTRAAAEMLGGAGASTGALDEVSATLEAASIDEQAGRELLRGRLSKPLPRPAGFGDVAALRPLEGISEEPAPAPSQAEAAAERRTRERQVREAETRERRVAERARRLREQLEELQAKVSAKKEEVRAAEADARGAALEVRRLRRSLPGD